MTRYTYFQSLKALILDVVITHGNLGVLWVRTES